MAMMRFDDWSVETKEGMSSEGDCLLDDIAPSKYCKAEVRCRHTLNCKVGDQPIDIAEHTPVWRSGLCSVRTPLRNQSR